MISTTSPVLGRNKGFGAQATSDRVGLRVTVWGSETAEAAMLWFDRLNYLSKMHVEGSRKALVRR